MNRAQLQRKVAIKRELDRRRSESFTVYGIYSNIGELLRCWQDSTGNQDYIQVDKTPTVKVMEKLEKFVTTKRRYKVVYGGRGSGKSETIGGILASQAKDYGIKSCCFREYQNSIEDSVHALLSGKVESLRLQGFTVQTQTIEHANGAQFKFRGLARNPEGIKSMYGFMRFWGEEAQATSANSLRLLTPTLRIEGSEIWMSLNPMSSADPVSLQFLKPFEKELSKNGFYEDELHLIIKMNYMDNPWFPNVLEQDRIKDKSILSSSMYNHVWEGDYNDGVENSLIDTDWFDACIDAHIKLGFKPLGKRFAAHDPSDTGPDDKGYADRHGSVVEYVAAKEDGTIHDGGDWATSLAINRNIDSYTWDCDGMGVGLSRQTDLALDGKKMSISMFKGSESPDNPDATYNKVEISGIIGQKKNKEVFKNKRAQYYCAIRDRCYKTYRAIEFGEYFDPEELISFSSKINCIPQLRSELCRIPLKPNANGLIQLYTKEEMKKKFNVPSPNLADCIMMLMRNHVRINKTFIMPQPLKRMGSQRC